MDCFSTARILLERPDRYRCSALPALTAAYHKVEDTVVGGYKKVENAFVDAFLEKVDEPESKDSEEKK